MCGASRLTKKAKSALLPVYRIAAAQADEREDRGRGATAHAYTAAAFAYTGLY
jgi:hypothetical protein